MKFNGFYESRDSPSETTFAVKHADPWVNFKNRECLLEVLNTL